MVITPTFYVGVVNIATIAEGRAQSLLLSAAFISACHVDKFTVILALIMVIELSVEIGSPNIP